MDLRASAQTDERLDIEEPDGKLVAIVQEFSERHPNDSVRLLSDDGGPMASALMVGVAVEPLPDAWRLPVETTKEEKELIRLKQELLRIKSSEPKFEIRFAVDESAVAHRAELDAFAYEPLKDSELESLLAVLQDEHPRKEKFEAPAKSERRTLLGQEIWVSPTKDSVEAYRREYGDWLDEARKLLSNLHTHLNERTSYPKVSLEVQNSGNRPGNHALVRISATGDILVTEWRESREPEPTPTRIANAPSAPKGQWQNSFLAANQAILSAQDFLGKSGQLLESGYELYSPPADLARLVQGPVRRDPNSLYPKSGSLAGSESGIEFECEQWRHAVGPFVIDLQIIPTKEDLEVEGLLTVQIHAENLTDVAATTLSVKIRRSVKNCFDVAERLIAGRLIAGE